MKTINVEDLAAKISKGDLIALAQGITLVESQKDEHWEQAKELLKKVYKKDQRAKRLGFSGPPGVGKSSFIEKLGLKLIERKQKIAVLAIDPSSQLSGGSILGDKTRMEELSRSPLAFVRPSPSRGHLGGVTSSLPAALILCEAAGFDWILIESVGVGQSEVELRHMADHFTLIAQPGAGDELQGIKKGILEYVDQIVVNKSDLDPSLVNLAKQQYLAALKIMRGKDIPVLSTSSLKNIGFDELVKTYEEFFNNFNFKNRETNFNFWFDSLLVTQFQKKLQSYGPWLDEANALKKNMESGQLLPFEAVDKFFKSLL